MANKRVSVKRQAQRALAADTKARGTALPPPSIGHNQAPLDAKAQSALDSFQNFAAKLGMGTDNLMAGSTYGFNPVTRFRTLLEWIHRGSWLGGMAVDIIADDMTRQGVEFTGSLDPKDEEILTQELTTLGIWEKLNEGIKWGRLYGGALIVPLIDGQDFQTPLRPERVGKNMFKGLMVLDRWMVDPDLQNLVTEFGPCLGLPKYYTVSADAPAIRQNKIHYTRAWRTGGIKLPYWQAVSENLWELSVIERFYDRMVAYDSATTGAAQLVYKSYLRTIKIKGFRELISGGGPAVQGLVASINFMSRFQTNEGLTILDSEDEFEGIESNAMNGVAKALDQFGQQVSGALQIPLVRLLGQSPAGLSSTGESDLRTYYDNIKQQQEKTLRTPFMNTITMVAHSKGITLPEDFNFSFRSLWQMTDKEKSEITDKSAITVIAAFQSGIIDLPTAMKELRQLATTTGVFNNITDKAIKEAENAPPMPIGPIDPETGEPMAVVPGQQQRYSSVAGPGGKKDEEEGGADLGSEKSKSKAAKKGANDGEALAGGFTTTPRMVGFHGVEDEIMGLPLVLEARKGEMRDGYKQIADYGYIRRTGSAEGKHEQLDCFVGPVRDSKKIFVIDSYWPDGRFDEHKVMFCFPNMAQAVSVFSRTYKDGRECRECCECSADVFHNWLAMGKQALPFARSEA